MDQQGLIKDVLGSTVPEAPIEGRYLPLEEAQRIVDETIDYVGRHGDAVTYKYLQGHHRRLSTTLTMIPMAETENSSFLDVGCFGYMALWARRHLGYAQAEGIELRPDSAEQTLKTLVRVNQDEVELKIYNFDISRPKWPIEGGYDTIIFLETLEHVNSDPMGIMLNVAERMHDRSTLVMSVPNAISYKTLQEFVGGMPPWTYWFFNPDLSHEARHCFEYTPIIFKTILRAAGLQTAAFRTICAYMDRQALDDVFAIGEALSIDPKLFGETMIAQARKDGEAQIVRYPDCIYDGERYYKSTFPLIEPRQRKAISSFVSSYLPARGEAAQLRAELEKARAKSRWLEEHAEKLQAQLSSALFACNGFLSEIERLKNDKDGIGWLSDRDGASRHIAREVWFEKQRWGLPYKIGTQARRLWASWRSKR